MHLPITVALTLALAAPAPTSMPVGEPAVATEPGERYRAANRPRWSRCLESTRPCVRPKPARLLLAAIGILGSAAGAAALLVAGERIGARDPAGLLIGSGGVAMAGAVLGAFSALTMGESSASGDRIRPSTLGLDLGLGRPAVLDEHHPPSLVMRAAPTSFFKSDHGRLRVFGHFGGRLGKDVDVDPRPQYQQDGFATALVEQQLRAGLGADLAVNLPYPVLTPGRSSFLGRAELRYKPEVQFRRHVYQPGELDERVVSRTMILPLTVGMRWHISPRQRFTFYMGPRFDVVSGSSGDGLGVERGKVEVGPIYGEAYYDVDVPFSKMRRRPRHNRAEVNGMLTLGYIHSRFDGMGFNISGAIGFAGPLQVVWQTRVRPHGSKVAYQAGIGTFIGNGVSPFLSLGVVLPDVGSKGSAR